MKIKLNVLKSLKQGLKVKAKAKEIERIDYIYEVINGFVNEKESEWISEIDAIIEDAKLSEIPIETIAKAKMEETKKKRQPIILNVDEKTYYAFEIMARKFKKTREDILIELLTDAIK